MADRFERYRMQTTLPQIGKAGQERLSSAKVAIVGIGALGTNSANLLARAGIGRLTLIDGDEIELTNLQRQVLYTNDDLGRSKVETAVEVLSRTNPDIEIVASEKYLAPGNIGSLLAGQNIVVDGTDNFHTRFLINDFSIREGTPWVYGGASGVEGMVLRIRPGKTPCLRCLIMHSDGPNISCDVTGVMNTVPSIVASLQTTEVIKEVLGYPPSSELIAFNGWTNEFTRIPIPRDPNCPSCVHGRFEVIGTEGFFLKQLCGGPGFQVILQKEISPNEVQDRFALRGKVFHYKGITFFEDGEVKVSYSEKGNLVIYTKMSEDQTKEYLSALIGV